MNPNDVYIYYIPNNDEEQTYNIYVAGGDSAMKNALATSPEAITEWLKENRWQLDPTPQPLTFNSFVFHWTKN